MANAHQGRLIDISPRALRWAVIGLIGLGWAIVAALVVGRACILHELRDFHIFSNAEIETVAMEDVPIGSSVTDVTGHLEENDFEYRMVSGAGVAEELDRLGPLVGTSSHTQTKTLVVAITNFFGGPAIDFAPDYAEVFFLIDSNDRLLDVVVRQIESPSTATAEP